MALALYPFAVLADVDASIATQVMREIHLTEAVASIASDYLRVVTAPLKTGGSDSSADDRHAAIDAAGVAFTPAIANKAALDVFRSGLDANMASEIRKWASSPLGQKVLAAEKRGASRVYLAYREEDAGTAQTLDAARRKAVTDIVVARGIVDSAMEVGRGQSVLVMRTLLIANPTRTDLPSERQLAERDVSTVERQMLRMMAPLFAELYAGVSTPELTRYLEFLGSPAGSKMTKLSSAAVSAVINESTAEFVQSLAPRSRAQMND